MTKLRTFILYILLWIYWEHYYKTDTCVRYCGSGDLGKRLLTSFYDRITGNSGTANNIDINGVIFNNFGRRLIYNRSAIARGFTLTFSIFFINDCCFGDDPISEGKCYRNQDIATLSGTHYRRS
ncbi:hypothetical protein TREAZ_2918 [Leadbettera azotonutricia ZAS-9]|uniref:Uncharacterized protein n=1 Tax=Leadbettera azotonutricia (strain ATCC BAA-888 / DSM 13862 / ZAS-9) TaxID=545695 RepID=F5YBU8_LEAAZ|nr:hypothetical protein TREAZ_2918 [Leadbettera azotonutricia ZAS-9]